MTFELERLYHRRTDIHAIYGGQQQGGISTPSNQPYIFLFTSGSGGQYGYIDRYDENGVFIYTGEGQVGDMKFDRGNLAIRDHVSKGKELLLFEASEKSGYYRYKGTFTCAGYDDSQCGLGTDGKNRKLIYFHLVPSETTFIDTVDEDAMEAHESSSDS